MNILLPNENFENNENEKSHKKHISANSGYTDTNKKETNRNDYDNIEYENGTGQECKCECLII
mgnify:CR=1 FL=1